MSTRRRKKKKHDEGSEEMSLQITSMADIFTIILVFLLKSFSTGMSNISPANGLKLPQVTASSKKEMKDALKLEVLSDSILVDGKQVVTMGDFQVPTLDGKSINTALVGALNEQRAAESRAPAAASGANSHLLVLADERTPYAALKVILGSAAMAGYVDLQMVVVGAGE